MTVSSSLVTIEATMTCPAAVPEGRFSVRLLRACDDPLDNEPSRATPAPAGIGGTGANTATSRPAITAAAKRVGRRDDSIVNGLSSQTPPNPGGTGKSGDPGKQPFPGVS